MNILLIDPPFYRFFNYYNRYFPLGLCYLASALKNAGHRVTIYDADCNKPPDATVSSKRKGMDYSRLPEKYRIYLRELQNPANPIIREISETLDRCKPDLVGITVMTPKAASAFTIAALVKKRLKGCRVVFGGPHATLMPDEILKNTSDVDFVVNGEGENVLLALANLLSAGNRDTQAARHEGGDAPDFSTLGGISYCHDGKRVHQPARRFIDDLDTLPFPDREAMLGANTYTSEDSGLLMGSRGCPYNCSYCATQIWTRKVRYRSLPNILEEIKHVRLRYKTRQFTFKDDSFTVNRKRVLEFCNALVDENIKINWDCNTRADLVDLEMLKMMKKAGCNSIKVGVESGSERILQLMDKGTTIGGIKEAARLFREAGIHWTAYFMMGVPTETQEDVRKTLALLHTVKPGFASIGVYEPFPGTRLFDVGVEKGLVNKEMSYDEFFTRIPSDYYLKDVARRVDTMGTLEFAALENEMKRAFHTYNRGFRRILERARARSSLYWHDPGIFFGDIEKFIGWI